jgi:predicted O-methyltransferase YrrM
MLFKPDSVSTRLLELQQISWAVTLRTLALPASVLLSRRDRHLVWRLWSVCFGESRPGVYTEIPSTLFFDGESAVRLLELRPEPFSITETELIVLAALARKVSGGNIFEFGTADGRTTLNLAANVGAGRVYSLNIELHRDETHHQEVPVGARFHARSEAAQITQLIGDAKFFDFTPYERRCQLVFVDADHSEAAALTDSLASLRLVDRQYGAIVWHDALRYGVQHVLPRLMKAHTLPIRLISGTNLAILCFAAESPVDPLHWTKCPSCHAS